MYHAQRFERTNRAVYARISDGWNISRIYASNEDELRAELRRFHIRPVTELTSKMCRGEGMDSRHISIIHKLL